MNFFSVKRVEVAIDHLSQFDSKWVILPWYLAANGVSRKNPVVVREGPAPPSDLSNRFFDGSRLGLPQLPESNNLLRPNFQDVKVTPGNKLAHQDTDLWNNVFSRTATIFKDRGYLVAEDGRFRLLAPFAQRLGVKLPNFHYEELLVWLFAFNDTGFAATTWLQLHRELLKSLGISDYPKEYLPTFAIDPTSHRVPWPTAGEILASRPSNQEFLAALMPKQADSTPDDVDPPSTPPTPETGTEAVAGGENVIICGAPGVGKSYRIESLFPLSSSRVTTVFHADTSNKDFVGSYEPHSTGNDADQKVVFEFVPGPFAKALVLALNNPKQKVVLVIEEISRARAAAVFGEIFQLLDRIATGRSKYTITPSAHLAKHLEKEVSTWKPAQGLFLPSNLSIYATMNPADQGVQRIDSAFRRRWRWQYLELTFAGCSYRDEPVKVGDLEATWSALAGALNDVLKTKLSLPEDRLIGPYFLTEDEIKDPEAIAGKLLHYLWDDVLRNRERDAVFLSNHKGFSDVSIAHRTSKPVFTAAIRQKIKPDEAVLPATGAP